MTETLFTTVNYSLSGLINAIEIGNIGLPDIQRPFVWPNAKVRDLFDSMYKGFPVGNFLFWESSGNGGHRVIGEDAKQKHPRLLIVDGQQRLTSLYAVIKGIPVVRSDYRKERIYLAFRPSDRTFKVTDAAVRKDPEYIEDISTIWSPNSDLFEIAEAYLQKLKGSRDVSLVEQKSIKQAISNLQSILNYPFNAFELFSNINEREVAEIFVRVNSKGTKLNEANFILTLMSVFWDEGRAALEEFCRNAKQPSKGSSSFNHFIHPKPENLLRVGVGIGFRRARLKHVYSLLRGKDLETDQFSDEQRDKQFSILKPSQGYAIDLQNWQEFFKVLTRAGFRSGDMISSKAGLLHVYSLFLIGKRDYHVDHQILRDLMARWFFATALTGRYTGSPESVMEEDFTSLREVESKDEFIYHFDRIIADTLSEDYWNITLPNKLATSSAISPALFAYYASLNLLDAKVLFSKMKITDLLDPSVKAKKKAVERHHLFPKEYLKTIGVIQTKDVNQIANYALVEWKDNIDILDKSPEEYFFKYADVNRFSDAEIQQMYKWHALPKGWERMEYKPFLEARRKLIAGIIREGFLTLVDNT